MKECPRCYSNNWKPIHMTDSFVCACGLIKVGNEGDEPILAQYAFMAAEEWGGEGVFCTLKGVGDNN